LLLALNGIGMGLMSAPNSAAVMNAVPASERGAASGMRATGMNAGLVLSLGGFFTRWRSAWRAGCRAPCTPDVGGERAEPLDKPRGPVPGTDRLRGPDTPAFRTAPRDQARS
jgi:hypothetical protein